MSIMEQVRKQEASGLLPHHSPSTLSTSYSRPVSAGKDCKYYKPWILRTPCLVFLLAIILTLIALVEYGFHALPKSGNNGLVRAVEGIANDYFSNEKRQVIASESDYYISTITTT